MKSFIPRLIAWGLLVMLAVVTALPNYSPDYMVMVVVVLAATALGMFVGKGHSLVQDLPWFVYGAIVLGILLPLVARNPLTVTARLEDVLEAFMEGNGDRSLLIFGTIAMVGAQMFLRKLENVLFIFVRYVAVTLFLLGVRLFFYGDWEFMYIPIFVIILTSAMYEVHTHTFGQHKRRTISCILTGILCIVSGEIFTLGGCIELEYLFTLQNWFPVLVMAALIGGLLIMEEENNKLLDKQVTHKDLGIALLCWSVQYAIMSLWPEFFNWFVLVPIAVICYFCYSMFTRHWHRQSNRRQDIAFYILWASILIGSLALGRSLNIYPLTAIVMVLLLVATVTVWRLSVIKSKEELGATCMFGVSAAVLLIVSGRPDLNDIPHLVLSAFSATLISIAWCLLCNTVLKLKHSVDTAYLGEFNGFSEILRLIPLPVMAVAVVRILFF